MKEKLTCLIPAGGEGTRLLPHTKNQQKPMLLMGNPDQRIIDFSLRLIGETDHTYVTTNHDHEKAEAVEFYVKQHRNVSILRDKRKIGGGSLIDYFEVFTEEDPGGSIAILPSDHVHKGLTLSGFYEHHQKSGMEVTLLTVPPKSYGEYVVVKNGVASKTITRPVQDSQSTTGIYIIKNTYFVDWIRRELKEGWDGAPRSLYRDFICPAIEEGKAGVYALSNDVYWDDAGTISRYHRNNMLLSNEESVISRDAQIETGVSIDSCVILESPVIEKGKFKRVVVSGLGSNFEVSQLTNG